MSTYIKSVTNSVEQNTLFPVLTLEEIGIYKNIVVRARRNTRWYNRDTGEGFTTQIIDVNFQFVDNITNEEIFKKWTEKLVPMGSTFGYGGTNRYGLRFNVGNGYYLCSDAYYATVTGGLTKTNDVWTDGYIREWDVYSVNYSNNMGFPSVDGTSRYVNGGWLLYYDEQNQKNNYLFVTTSSDLSGGSVAYPGQGASYLTLICFDDIPNFNFEDIVEKSDEYGDYSESGGYGGGSFDDSSDAFGLPELPSLGVSEAGFVNVYRPSSGQLIGFADELFPNFDMPTPSTKEGLEGVVENLNNVASVLGFFADSYLNRGLVDYVIDCHIVPISPKTTENSGIKVGYKTFDYNPKKVTSDYVEFDCGSLEIAEYYQNFLDYEGTRAKLYCPFVGFVDIKPEWFQSGSLRLVYHFNIIDGSCIAFVIATSSKSKLKNTVVATFGGNCCVHMPITGLNYSSMISGVLSGAGTISSSLQSGSLPGAIAGIEQIALARPSLEQSNGYNGGMSFMCYRRPYLLIERPVASFSKNYPSEQGLPLNVTKKLSDIDGFTVCDSPIFNNFVGFDSEKDLLKSLLESGIIL